MQNWCTLAYNTIQWMSSHLYCGIPWNNWPTQSSSEEVVKTEWIILSLKVNLWWCGEAVQSVLSLSQSLAHYRGLIKRCSFYFLSYALNVEAYDRDGRFSQAPKEGRHPGKKCKSVYVGIREERGWRNDRLPCQKVNFFPTHACRSGSRGEADCLTCFWKSSMFQQSEKNIIFITIKKRFCTYSICKWVLQCCSVEG